MKMPKWMNGNTLKYPMKNENIRGKLEIIPKEDKMRWTCLIWFYHVQRRPIDAKLRKMIIKKLKTLQGDKKI